MPICLIESSLLCQLLRNNTQVPRSLFYEIFIRTGRRLVSIKFILPEFVSYLGERGGAVCGKWLTFLYTSPYECKEAIKPLVTRWVFETIFVAFSHLVTRWSYHQFLSVCRSRDSIVNEHLSQAHVRLHVHICITFYFFVSCRYVIINHDIFIIRLLIM